jgi:hypothetical protein
MIDIDTLTPQIRGMITFTIEGYHYHRATMGDDIFWYRLDPDAFGGYTWYQVNAKHSIVPGLLEKIYQLESQSFTIET